MKILPFNFRFSAFVFLLFFMGNVSAQVDSTSSPDGMNNKKMEVIFKSEVEELEGN